MNVQPPAASRIVIIFWNLGLGGVQKRIYDITNSLSTTDSVKIVILLKQKVDQEISFPKHPSISIRYFNVGRPKQAPLQFFLWLLFQCIDFKPTCIVGFMNKCAILSVIIGYILRFISQNPKIVISEEIYLSYYLKQHNARVWKYLTIIFYRFATVIIVLTQAMKRDLVYNFFVPEEKTVVMPSWIPTIKHTSHRKRIWEYVYIGRLSPEKGINSLITLAKTIKQRNLPYSICIVGDGPLRAWMLRQISKYHLEKYILYKGYQTNPISFIRRSRLLLLPSVNEGLPLVVLESYAAGVPVLATSFAGASEMIDHNSTGWVCKSQSQFIKTALEIIKQPTAISRAGREAYIFARTRYSRSNLQIFLSLLS